MLFLFVINMFKANTISLLKKEMQKEAPLFEIADKMFGVGFKKLYNTVGEVYVNNTKVELANNFFLIKQELPYLYASMIGTVMKKNDDSLVLSTPNGNYLFQDLAGTRVKNYEKVELGSIIADLNFKEDYYYYYLQKL